MRWFLFGAAGLHLLFMIAELFPWRLPVLLRIAAKKLPSGEGFSASQQALIATIVHNAGVYNGIIAGGMLWAALHVDSSTSVAAVMFAGSAAAGAFGTATLKSPLTAVQALVGPIGLFLIRF